MPRPPFRPLLLAALSLVPLLAAAPAWANMASPTAPGTPAGEPAEALAGLRVVREDLTLDLRPLGRGRPFAVVEAEYLVVNGGPGRLVVLEFLALGDDVGAAEVWVDGQPVPSEAVDSLAVPALWRVTETTPALGGDPLPYQADDGVGAPRGLRFAAPLPTGRHTVRVRYRVRPGAYGGDGHPNWAHQLAYSLAPARRWAGFGQLDVQVIVPEGWDVAASLPLRREDVPGADALVGSFPGVPGDVLAVSARAPAPVLLWPLRAAGALAWALVVGFAGALGGRLAARSRSGAWAAFPVSLLGATAGGVALFALWATASDLGTSPAYGYGGLFVGLGLGLAGFAVGAAVAQALAVALARRRRTEVR